MLRPVARTHFFTQLCAGFKGYSCYPNLVVFDARGLGDVRAAPHASVKHHRPLHLATADAVKGAVARDGRGHGGEGIKRTGAAVQLRPPWLGTMIPSAPLPHHAHNVHTPGTGLQKCSAQLRKVQVGLNKNVEHVALQESMVAMASSARSTPFTMSCCPQNEV